MQRLLLERGRARACNQKTGETLASCSQILLVLQAIVGRLIAKKGAQYFAAAVGSAALFPTWFDASRRASPLASAVSLLRVIYLHARALKTRWPPAARRRQNNQLACKSSVRLLNATVATAAATAPVATADIKKRRGRRSRAVDYRATDNLDHFFGVLAALEVAVCLSPLSHASLCHEAERLTVARRRHYASWSATRPKSGGAKKSIDR